MVEQRLAQRSAVPDERRRIGQIDAKNDGADRRR
jgi:hypothetical protein